MKIRYLLTLQVLLLATPVSADDSALFLAVKASLGDVTMSDNSTNGIGNGMIFGGRLDGTLEDDTVDDITAGLGVSVGKRWGNWLAEVEYTYRYRTDWDLAALTDSIATVTNVFSNVETNTLMFNVARRGVLTQYWSWELGAGVGWVSNDIEADYIERAVPSVSPQRTFKDSGSESDFTYAVFAGVTHELSGGWLRDWTLNLRARYLDLGELEVGPFLPDRPGRVSAEMDTIELQFSLERNLR